MIDRRNSLLPSPATDELAAWPVRVARSPKGKWLGSFSLLGIAGYCFSQYTTLGDISSMTASTFFLGVATMSMMVWAWGAAANISHYGKLARWAFPLIVFVAALFVYREMPPKKTANAVTQPQVPGPSPQLVNRPEPEPNPTSRLVSTPATPAPRVTHTKLVLFTPTEYTSEERKKAASEVQELAHQYDREHAGKHGMTDEELGGSIPNCKALIVDLFFKGRKSHGSLAHLGISESTS